MSLLNNCVKLTYKSCPCITVYMTTERIKTNHQNYEIVAIDTGKTKQLALLNCQWKKIAD
jgi:hypothetical protein